MKLGCLYKLVETVDKCDKRACFHALGCLYQLVDSDDFKTLIGAHTGAKLIRCLGECLNKLQHPRTQVVSSRILFRIASNPEIAGRLALITPKLVEALHMRGPVWIRDFHEVCTQAAGCLQILAALEATGDLQPGGTLSGSNKKAKVRTSHEQEHPPPNLLHRHRHCGHGLDAEQD